MANRKTHNNATLTIRLPEAILTKFTTMCDGIYKTPSEVTRQLILDYVHQHIDYLNAIDNMKDQKQKPKQYPSQGMYPSGNDMTPSNYGDDWV